MRKLLALTLALFATTALASGKIGVVDMEQALFLSDAAKTSIKAFEKENQEEVNKLKALQADLMKLREKLEKEADVLSESERTRLANNYEQKATEYKFYAQKLQESEQKWRQRFLQEQLPSLEVELKAIIDKEKYDLVLQSGAVIYRAPTVDLTKQLIDRLNAKK